MSVAQCAQLVGATVRRVPTISLCRIIVETMWALGATSIPPDAFPYLMGSYSMDISKLRTLLGKDYERVMRYSNESALVDSVVNSAALTVPAPASAPEGAPTQR